MTAAEEAGVVVDILRRAALATVKAQTSSPGTIAQLGATLDELCAALSGGPHEKRARAARAALPAPESVDISDDALAGIGDALDEISR